MQGPENAKLGHYLENIVRELRMRLGIDGRQQLQRIISQYLATLDTQLFSRCIHNLVDEHQVVVQLPHATQRHGPYIRHIPLAEQQRNLVMQQQAMQQQQHQYQQQQAAAERAGMHNLEMERRMQEECGMLPGMIPMSGGPTGRDTATSHRGGGCNGVRRLCNIGDMGGIVGTMSTGQIGGGVGGEASCLLEQRGIPGSLSGSFQSGTPVACLQLQHTELSQFLTGFVLPLLCVSLFGC